METRQLRALMLRRQVPTLLKRPMTIKRRQLLLQLLPPNQKLLLTRVKKVKRLKNLRSLKSHRKKRMLKKSQRSRRSQRMTKMLKKEQMIPMS